MSVFTDALYCEEIRSSKKKRGGTGQVNVKVDSTTLTDENNSQTGIAVRQAQ